LKEYDGLFLFLYLYPLQSFILAIANAQLMRAFPIDIIVFQKTCQSAKLLEYS